MTLVFHPSFAEHSLAENAAQLVAFFGLTGEVAVPVTRFNIVSDEGRTYVDVKHGKYKSALLILYLSSLVPINADPEQPFRLTDEMRQTVRDYFGSKLCAEAENDPTTVHTTIRALLTGTNVSIALKLYGDG